jgi:hypothetical protein
VHANYALSEQIKLRLGVVNVTNEHPPLLRAVTVFDGPLFTIGDGQQTCRAGDGVPERAGA